MSNTEYIKKLFMRFIKEAGEMCKDCVKRCKLLSAYLPQRRDDNVFLFIETYIININYFKHVFS